MTAQSAKQLTDSNGHLLQLQYYDELSDSYKPGGNPGGGGGGGGGGDASAANQLAVIGAKAPGIAAAFSSLAGGLYNSGNITLTNGQQAALQLNAAGSLRVQLLGSGAAGPDVAVGNADGATPSNGKLAVAAYVYLKNTAGTYDQLPGNTKGIFTTQSPQTGTSRSVAITAATATAGNLFPANTTRSRYLIQNNGAAVLWISFGGVATVAGLDCMAIGPGQFYAGDSDTTSISGISATGSLNIFAREW